MGGRQQVTREGGGLSLEGTVVVVGGQMGGMSKVVEDISLSRAVFGISSWQALDSFLLARPLPLIGCHTSSSGQSHTLTPLPAFLPHHQMCSFLLNLLQMCTFQAKWDNIRLRAGLLYTSRGIPEEAEQGESRIGEGGERVILDLSS